MGVPGLMSYICKNAKSYLNPYELSDCSVVIDGGNIAYNLARKAENIRAFGGDYDEYYELVKTFMSGLKKCNIYPIFVFDGGCKEAKFKAKINRRHETLMRMKSFSRGFSARKAPPPLFLVEVFTSVVKDMEFACIECDLEADEKISAIARQLNWPILSNDSDFFIRDEMFIPYCTVQQLPLKYSHSDKYYIRCSVFKSDVIFKTVGFDKSLLPVLITLLGNDIVDDGVFLKFFGYLELPLGRKYVHERISKLLKWLENENFNSAVNSISKHLEGKNEEVLRLFYKVAEYYNPSTTLTEAMLNELSNKFGKMDLSNSNPTINWPPEIARPYAQTVIPHYLTNWFKNQIYLTHLQIKAVYEGSTHLKSLNLVKKIYAMLTPTMKKPLEVYLVLEGEYKPLKIYADTSCCINLDEVWKQSNEKRLKLLYDIVGVDMDDLKFLPGSWAIPIMGFIYWYKEYEATTQAHMHAFIILMIANQIVKAKIDQCRQSPVLEKSDEEMDRLKPPGLILSKSRVFSEMLSNLKYDECLVAHQKLLPIRKAKNDYCLSTIHLFNCFQACMFYIMIINQLLNYPLPHCRVDFYSGSLFFNLYRQIVSKSSFKEFGSSLFLKTPNLNEIYKYLFIKLSRISSKKVRNEAQLKMQKLKMSNN